MTQRLAWPTAGTLTLALLLPLAACDTIVDPAPPPPKAELIVNSVDNSLTVVAADGPGDDAHNIGLGAVAASPVSAAARLGVAVVPEGIYPFAAIVALGSGTVSSVALPAN